MLEVIDAIEKKSEVYPPEDFKDYFSEKITIFKNPFFYAADLQSKFMILANIEELLEDIEEGNYSNLAIEAALAYIECGGGEQ